MSKKQKFLEFWNYLVCEFELDIPAEVSEYISALESDEKEKPMFTDNGKLILKGLQTLDKSAITSKELAEHLGVTSRLVSGAFQKLVKDGFVEKIGKDPVVYSLTESGKNIVID